MVKTIRFRGFSPDGILVCLDILEKYLKKNDEMCCNINKMITFVHENS